MLVLPASCPPHCRPPPHLTQSRLRSCACLPPPCVFHPLHLTAADPPSFAAYSSLFLMCAGCRRTRRSFPPGTLILLIPPPPTPPTPPTPTHPHTTTTTTHLPPHPCPTAGCRRTRRSCRSAGPPPRCRTACSAWAPTCPASCPSTPVSFLGGRGGPGAVEMGFWCCCSTAEEELGAAQRSARSWALGRQQQWRLGSACSAFTALQQRLQRLPCALRPHAVLLRFTSCRC